MTRAITLRLPDEMHEKLRRAAFEGRTSITSLVLAAIEAQQDEPEVWLVQGTEEISADGIYGVFATEDLAKECAANLAALSPDPTPTEVFAEPVRASLADLL